MACDIGYGIYSDDGSLLDTLRLACENREGSWKETKPECSKIDVPESVEEILTISIDSNPFICEDTSAQDQVIFFYLRLGICLSF